jgi:hypothetical protein
MAEGDAGTAVRRFGLAAHRWHRGQTDSGLLGWRRPHETDIQLLDRAACASSRVTRA